MGWKVSEYLINAIYTCRSRDTPKSASISFQLCIVGGHIFIWITVTLPFIERIHVYITRHAANAFNDFLLYILRVTFINLFYINKMEKLAFVNVHCALCVALFFCFLTSFILKSWTNCNQYFMCTLIWAFVVHTCCLSLRNAFWHFVGVRHLAHFQHNSAFKSIS